MIRIDAPQGSGEWFAARLGIPTASQFDRIVTATGKVSGAQNGYRNELLAEYLLGESLDTTEYDFTARGTAMEEDARAYYELLKGVDVDRVGFLIREGGDCGGSPDGLVNLDGGLELKCPSAAVHVGYLLDSAGTQYKHQIQGNLWIAERDWWDFLSYHPTLPKALVRCYRDETYIAALAAAMDQFCDGLAAAKETLAARGHVPVVKEAAPLFVGVG